MNVKIEMTAAEALAAIEQNLIAPLLKSGAKNVEAAPTAPAAPVQIITTAPAAPVPVPETPAAVATAIPTTAPVAAPEIDTPAQEAPAVPTSAHQYTMDEISRAAVQLMDQGKQQELLALLKQLGVNSVVELKPEQYGQFATELRGKGAQI